HASRCPSRNPTSTPPPLRYSPPRSASPWTSRSSPPARCPAPPTRASASSTKAERRSGAAEDRLAASTEGSEALCEVGGCRTVRHRFGLGLERLVQAAFQAATDQPRGEGGSNRCTARQSIDGRVRHLLERLVVDDAGHHPEL